MPDTRVGSLDNPQRYGRRSIAVYANTTGYYFKLDGAREKVHGSQLWTSTGHIKMRGSAPVNDGAPIDHAWDDEEDQLAVAIAASLEDALGGPQAEEAGYAAAGRAADDAAGGVAGGAASRHCSICLEEPTVMIMKPCNHCCACQTCAGRLVRRPCPMCRRMVTQVERIYF